MSSRNFAVPSITLRKVNYQLKALYAANQCIDPKPWYNLDFLVILARTQYEIKNRILNQEIRHGH